MKVQCLWYGGSNYAIPQQSDIETFYSLKRAKEVFEHRASNRDSYFPCVQDSEMHIYFHEYTENGPDRILKLGPRGGIVMEKV